MRIPYLFVYNFVERVCGRLPFAYERSLRRAAQPTTGSLPFAMSLSRSTGWLATGALIRMPSSL